MTRRLFLGLFLQRPVLERLSREPKHGVSEIPSAEGFLVRGAWEPATGDGSASYALGDHVVTFHEPCALRAGTDVLLGQTVTLELRRA